MDITALRHAMASGALTAAELTTSCLTRAQELNPVLHAVTRLSDQALAEAAACDQAQATGATPGPLAGIPVLIKDNIEVRGMPATAGSPALAEVDAHDCFLVRRLREAGAVILGKANLSEWANFRAMPSTSGWSTLGGQAANPYALDRNPSGSSSGSAIAVAVGLVPLAVGTETDGSIVSPASACGIVGIKPTVGLLSRAGIVPVSLAQDTAGPMARSVADAAALLSVLAGHDPADPATSPAAGQPRDYTAFLDPGALAGARLGVWRDGARGAGTATRAVLETALAVLREAGAETIDPVALPGAADIEEAELTALLWEFKHDLNAYLAGLRGPHPANLAAIIDFNTHNATTVLATFGQEIFEHAEETSGDLADAGYRAARSAAARLARESLDRPLAEHRLDAIVALTASPAWLTDYVTGDPKTFSSSVPAAVAGYPAVCVPAGQVCGLPVGLSFIGPAWSEPRLIGLAHAFERAATPLPAPSLAPSCQSPMGAGAGASRR
ncbi:MAG TPA: amidase [Streptosporangiaceae bacterium]|nr:amidase [Streptosporangiaceae bacterium]